MEIGHAVADFIDRREQLPPQTHVDGQTAGDPPIVLHERAERAVALSHCSGEALAVSHIGWQAEQEIGLGVAGVMAAESDLPGSAVVAGRGDVVVAVTQDLESGVHGVRAVNDVPFRRTEWWSGGRSRARPRFRKRRTLRPPTGEPAKYRPGRYAVGCPGIRPAVLVCAALTLPSAG